MQLLLMIGLLMVKLCDSEFCWCLYELLVVVLIVCMFYCSDASGLGVTLLVFLSFLVFGVFAVC